MKVDVKFVLVYVAVLGTIKFGSSTSTTLKPNSIEPVPNFIGRWLNTSLIEVRSNNQILIEVVERKPNDTENLSFIAGTTDEISLQSGTQLPAIVHRNGLNSTILVTLSDSILSSLKWLGVYQSSSQSEFIDYQWLENVPLSVKSPPQTFGFDSERAKSGPIVFLDKSTLFVSNLQLFDLADSNSMVFCVSFDSELSDCEPMQNQNGDNVLLKSNLRGSNYFLKFPAGYSSTNSTFLALYLVDEKKAVATIEINGTGALAPELRLNYEDTQLIRMVPKCCPMSQMLDSETNACVDTTQVLKFMPNINLFEHNATHLNNKSLVLKNYVWVPYHSKLECEHKFPLDPIRDTFALLMNGSLILAKFEPRYNGIKSQGEFCMEFTKTLETFMCYIPESDSFLYAYVAFQSASLLCLSLAIVLHYFFYTYEDDHKSGFMLFILAMDVTFICKIGVRYAEADAFVKTIGFIYQISMISSYVWLSLLCFDVLALIANYKNVPKKGRFIYFNIIVAAVFLISFIISLSRGLTPSVPNSFYHPNKQQTNDENVEIYLFYAPIMISILVSLIFLCLAIYHYAKNCRVYNGYDHDWIMNKEHLRFLLVQNIIICTIMTFSWLSNYLRLFVDTTEGILKALIAIDCSQGVIIVMIFMLYHYKVPLVIKRLTKSKLKKTGVPQEEPTDHVELTNYLNGIR